MDATVGKHNRTDDESIRARQKPELQFSTARKREEQRVPSERNKAPSSTKKKKDLRSRAINEADAEEIGGRDLKRKYANENVEKKPRKAKIKLRASDDFNSNRMNGREEMELRNILDRTRVIRQKDTHRMALTCKRGDKLETIASADNGGTDGWRYVRHLESGKIGFIPRNRAVMEKDYQPSKTTLTELPFELLDIILENSFLHWIINSSPDQRDEDVVKSLATVSFCWFQRITRNRFKKRIWRRFKDFYGNTKKRSASIRNNINYLLDNIQPNDELIALLLSLNCITEERSQFIQRQRLNRDKNYELLNVMASFDETQFSKFVKCLQQNDQKMVARIIENGGGVIKIEVQTSGAKYTTLMEAHLLHDKIEDLRNRTKPRLDQTDKLISQLKEEGVEILNSQLDRQTVVVWIWCHSQEALEHIRRLYESNQLTTVIFETIQPSTSRMINIDGDQFKKTVFVCPISINFTQRIKIIQEQKHALYVRGVTKLRNKIYVLCRSKSLDSPPAICVYEHQNSFRLRKIMKIAELNSPVDIGSCEKENCLYVCDDEVKCVWKITTETDDQYKIIKWLTTDYRPRTLSMSSEGQLLLLRESTSILMIIYGSDAELIRSIQLPRDIENPIHAVETSIGNFVILHRWSWAKEEVGDGGSSGRKTELLWVVSELTRDGQMLICRFFPVNETQKLQNPRYLSLSADDQVFVVDTGNGDNGRLILLDTDLKWNRILCPIKEDKEKTRIQSPERLYYDEEKKQLIVGGYIDVRDGLVVCTFSRH